MKVLILGKLPPPFIGPALATQIILNSKLKNHFELIHLKTNAHSEISEMGKFSVAKIFNNIKIYFKLYFILWRTHPQIILVPFDQSTIGFIKDAFLIMIASLFKNKIILQLRGSNFKNWIASTSITMRKIIRFVLKKGDGIIVLGKNLTNLFEDYFDKNKIFVIPNGSNYIFPVRKNEEEPINLLFLGNLQPTKGIEDVILSISLLDKTLVNKIILNVIGSWRDEITKENCLRLVNINKLPATFLGPLYDKEKLQHMINSDIFIFPPRAPEGHPWVIVEAMAAGLPIISTNQGAITESVIDQVNGYIVECNSPKQIAEKLELLIKDEKLRIKMGKESRRLYEENFTEEKMVERLKQVFDSALGEG